MGQSTLSTQAYLRKMISLPLLVLLPLLAASFSDFGDYQSELELPVANQIDFEYDGNSFGGARVERDGFGHGGAGGRQQRQQKEGRQGGQRRAGRKQRVQEQPRRQQRLHEPRQQQEERGGRQTGGTALAQGFRNTPTDAEGNYDFNFSNDDGSTREEFGEPAFVQGSYSFVAPNGEVVSMQYTADENGYHASGSHMPTPPPMPLHVQRLLDHLAKVNGGL